MVVETNVLKLYYALVRDETQLPFYISAPAKHKDSGSASSGLEVLTSLLKLDPLGLSLSLFGAFVKSEEAARMSRYAFGAGIVEQLASAYKYLVDHYEEGGNNAGMVVPEILA